MKRKIIIGILICFIFMFITGCWNNRSLNRMSFATAIGFDKLENEKIEVTAQLVKPAVVGAKEKTGGEEAVWVYSYSAETVFAALRGMLTTVSRKIFVGHVQLIVIEDDLAKEGIVKVLDLFDRDHETNRKADLLISRGIKAKEVLKAKSELEDIPAVHIKQILENNTAYAKINEVELFNLLTCLPCPGFSPAIGVIQPENESKEEMQIKDLKVEGTALFAKDKLVGWLSPTETRGLLFIQNKVESGIINITNPLEEDEKVAFEIIRADGKKEVKLERGELKFLIEVSAIGRLGEQPGRGNLVTPEMIGRLEPKVARIIKANVRDVVNLAQTRYYSDIFGFSKIIHREYLNYWNKVKDNWKQVFSETPVQIKVDWEIRSSGTMKRGVESR